MFLYAARQPILDTEKNLFAYELLFRDSLDNVFPEIDADEATSKLIESQLNIGIEDFTGDKPAFINFTLDTLLKKYPTLIHPEHLVVEILETISPGKKLLSEIQQLKQGGYTIALDDYIHQPVWAHFYPYVDIIKVDFMHTTYEQILEIKASIQNYPQIKLLAEKVETLEDFNQAIQLGFSLFQGYFFSKPEVVQSRTLNPAQLTIAELLFETSKSELDFVKITKVFERDVSLSYKLLRYSNSAIFKRRTEISTIKQALMVLGTIELKKFLSVLFAAQVGSDKPVELTKLSMSRARFAELMAAVHKDDPSTAFLTGLMSLIDAMLDEPIATVMNKLPLAEPIKKALVERKGIMAFYIEISKCFENADWVKAEKLITKIGLDKNKIPSLYQEAVHWSDVQMTALEN